MLETRCLQSLDGWGPQFVKLSIGPVWSNWTNGQTFCHVTMTCVQLKLRYWPFLDFISSPEVIFSCFWCNTKLTKLLDPLLTRMWYLWESSHSLSVCMAVWLSRESATARGMTRERTLWSWCSGGHRGSRRNTSGDFSTGLERRRSPSSWVRSTCREHLIPLAGAWI